RRLPVRADERDVVDALRLQLAHEAEPIQPWNAKCLSSIAMPTLIFDCDGVIAESERDGHWPAFNRAFAELGVPVRWSEDEYGEKLLVSGGKERVATVLTPKLLRATGLPSDPDGRREWLRALPRGKEG